MKNTQITRTRQAEELRQSLKGIKMIVIIAAISILFCNVSFALILGLSNAAITFVAVLSLVIIYCVYLIAKIKEQFYKTQAEILDALNNIKNKVFEE